MFIFFCFYIVTVSGQREGETCTHPYTNTLGRCTPVDQCQTAIIDYQQNGIRTSFCSYRTFGNALVCCRDGFSILQEPTPNRNENRPIWGNGNRRPNRKRVCERKCEEYSRGVVQKVEYIPLIPDPEALSVSAAKCDYNTIELIIGGENAEPGEFPHMAAIGWVDFNDDYIFACGGSLISPKFVLTAGHCTRNRNAKNELPAIVRLGDQNIDNSVNDGANPVDVPIRNIHVNPNYQSPVKYNDIALFELASDVPFSSTIRAACLWTKPNFPGYEKVVATGWGVTDPNGREPSKELKKVALKLYENNHCDSLLSWLKNRNWDGFRSSQMCAGELRGGMDTCQGDSGSPLQVASKDNQCIFYVVGITSFGKQCAKSDSPGVYTRVSSYLDWIEQVPIRNIHVNPNYQSPVKYNDIALFELASDVPFSSTIRAACLWTKPNFPGYEKVVATGWGVTDPNGREPSKELKKVALKLYENSHCDSLLSWLKNRNWDGFRSSQMCAGELRGGMDTCQGDSGSPLQVASKDNQCIFYVVGITSFGKQCAKSDSPGVYTRVSSYLDWIEQVVWPGEQ